MAYASSLDTNRRLGTLTIVAGLHVAAGFVLVNGLAAKFLPRPAPNRVIADNFRLPPPKPVETPKPADPAPQTRDRPQLETKTVVPMDDFPIIPSPGPIVDSIPGVGTGGDIGEVHIPVPAPKPPLPTLVRGARPKGNPGLWVTANDYPAADLRQDHAGVTRFKLAIGADGRVTDCTVTGSSGYPGLDAAACAKLTARGRFEPAIDSTGARLEGTYSSSVRWQIPE